MVAAIFVCFKATYIASTNTIDTCICDNKSNLIRHVYKKISYGHF